RLAELLRPAAQRGGDDRGHELSHGPHRGALPTLRRAPPPPGRRWTPPRPAPPPPEPPRARPPAPVGLKGVKNRSVVARPLAITVREKEGPGAWRPPTTTSPTSRSYRLARPSRSSRDASTRSSTLSPRTTSSGSRASARGAPSPTERCSS